MEKSILLLLTLLVVAGELFADFSYIAYLTPAEAASAGVEQFSHDGLKHMLISVQGKPMFLVKTHQNGTTELLTDTDEVVRAVDSYAMGKINFSDEIKAQVKAQMREFNESLHATVKIMSIEFHDPIYDCGRQFGIDVYKNTECTTKANCQSMISVYCAARPGFCPDIGTLSTELFNFEDAARTILSRGVEFDRKIGEITKGSSAFKAKATELAAIVDVIDAKTKDVKNSILRYPATGLTECPTCYGVCPAVPADTNILASIKATLSLWKKGSVDTNMIKKFLDQGIKKVKKKDMEKVTEKLKKELSQFETEYKIEDILTPSVELLKNVEDQELRASYEALVKARTEADSAANLASEQAFATAMENYQDAYLAAQGYNFSKFAGQLEEIIENQKAITGGLMYLKYAEDWTFDEFQAKAKVLSEASAFPVKAEAIPKIIEAQGVVRDSLFSRIAQLSNRVDKVASGSYFALAFALTQPIVKLIFGTAPATPEQINNIIYGSMWIVTLIILFATVSFVALVFMIIWYGWLRAKKGKSLAIKAVFVLIGLGAIGVAMAIETFGTFSMHGLITKANVIDYNNAIASQSALLIIANRTSDSVMQCAIDTLTSLNLSESYVLDSKNATCHVNGELMADTVPCAEAYKRTDVPLMVFHEGTANEAAFTLMPKPVATLNYPSTYYDYCVPKTAFRISK